MISNKNNVFNVTAVDTTNIRHSSEAEQIRVYPSIISVKPGDLIHPFIFTEYETNKAMMTIGVVNDDLIKMSYSQKQKIPGTPQMQQKIYEELENRRISTFQLIVQTREKILQDSQKSTTTKRKMKPNKNQTINYNRLKEKQLNSLIEYQNKHNQVYKNDLILSKTQKKNRKIRNDLNDRKQKSHLLRSLQPENETNDQIEQFIMEREQQKQSEIDQLKSLQQYLSKLPKRQQKSKGDEIAAFQKKMEENENNFNQQLEMLKSQANSINPELISLINSQPNKNARIEYRKKEREKYLLNQERQKIIDERKAKLEKQLLEKESKVEANLRLISTQKIRHFHEIQAKMKKRGQSAACTKQLLEEQRLEKLKKTFEKQEEAIQRANALKAQKTNELLEKAGKRWLKQKYATDYAKRVQIQKKYQCIEKVEKIIQKQEHLQKEKEEIEKQEILNFRNKTITKLNRQKEYEEFKKEIQSDPNADPYQLATKYKINTAKLKKPMTTNE